MAGEDSEPESEVALRPSAVFTVLEHFTEITFLVLAYLPPLPKVLFKYYGRLVIAFRELADNKSMFLFFCSVTLFGLQANLDTRFRGSTVSRTLAYIHRPC